MLQEKRGRVYVPKETDTSASELNGEVEGDVKTDFDDILNQATEEELVDLAGNYYTRAVSTSSSLILGYYSVVVV